MGKWFSRITNDITNISSAITASIVVCSLLSRLVNSDTIVRTTTWSSSSDGDITCEPCDTNCTVTCTSPNPDPDGKVFSCGDDTDSLGNGPAIHCPTNTSCTDCTINCDVKEACSSSTIYGHDCDILNVNVVGKDNKYMTIHAPDNGGSLFINITGIGKIKDLSEIYAGTNTNNIIIDCSGGEFKSIVNASNINGIFSFESSGLCKAKNSEFYCPRTNTCTLEFGGDGGNTPISIAGTHLTQFTCPISDCDITLTCLDSTVNCEECGTANECCTGNCVAPTSNPTFVPSMLPTTQLSLHPSLHPTIHPSFPTTIYPTVNPTSNPTTNPTQATFGPTNEPTNHPSSPTTFNPSQMPSIPPTIQQTNLPSTHPTIFPSFQPSTVPTLHPSIQPTIPSTNPTNNPSISSDPSKYPTNDPTKYPTYSPTINPTWYPTSNPNSITPTNSPQYSALLSGTTNDANIPIIIAVLGISCVILCCLILAFIFYRKRKKQSTQSSVIPMKTAQLVISNVSKSRNDADNFVSNSNLVLSSSEQDIKVNMEYTHMNNGQLFPKQNQFGHIIGSYSGNIAPLVNNQFMPSSYQQPQNPLTTNMNMTGYSANVMLNNNSMDIPGPPPPPMTDEEANLIRRSTEYVDGEVNPSVYNNKPATRGRLESDIKESADDDGDSEDDSEEDSSSSTSNDGSEGSDDSVDTEVDEGDSSLLDGINITQGGISSPPVDDLVNDVEIIGIGGDDEYTAGAGVGRANVDKIELDIDVHEDVHEVDGYGKHMSNDNNNIRDDSSSSGSEDESTDESESDSESESASSSESDDDVVGNANELRQKPLVNEEKEDNFNEIIVGDAVVGEMMMDDIMDEMNEDTDVESDVDTYENDITVTQQ